MATSKTQTVTMQYQNNATSPTSVSFTAEPIVNGGVLGFDHHVIRPGVFTAGTPVEGSSSNPQNDSNA